MLKHEALLLSTRETFSWMVKGRGVCKRNNAGMNAVSVHPCSQVLEGGNRSNVSPPLDRPVAKALDRPQSLCIWPGLPAGHPSVCAEIFLSPAPQVCTVVRSSLTRERELPSPPDRVWE